MADVNVLVILIAGAMTLSIFSYLWRENLAFRIAEHAYMGAAVGYGALVTAEGAGRILMPHINSGEYLWLIAPLIGIMYLGFFSEKYFYLYRYPIAIALGTGMALRVSVWTKTSLIGQAQTTTLVTDISSAIVAIGVITALYYFYATHENRGQTRYISRVGRLFIMAAFGAQMGLHVMARTSLVIGRIRFLLFTYPANYLIPVAFILIIVGVYRDRQKKA